MNRYSGKYLVLYAFCKFVAGKEQAIICDLQKRKIKFVPIDMGSVLALLKKYSVDVVITKFNTDKKILNEYFDFLLEEDFAFLTTDPKPFLDLPTEFISPEVINNAIIEYGFCRYDILKTLDQLDALLTKHIELRFLNMSNENLSMLDRILEFCDSSLCKNIQLFVPYVNPSLQLQIFNIVAKYVVVNRVCFYNSDIKIRKSRKGIPVYYLVEKLENIRNSNIKIEWFICDLAFFHEAQKYNPYYHKKIAIDENGNIKNCIKNKRIFGNVNNKDIKSVISTASFQELWNANHDKIIKIKDMELRYNIIVTNDLRKKRNGFYEIVE